MTRNFKGHMPIILLGVPMVNVELNPSFSFTWSISSIGRSDTKFNTFLFPTAFAHAPTSGLNNIIKLKNLYLDRSKLFKPTAFPYSPENPPSAETLWSRIYAVHATNIFPQNGVIKTGANPIHGNLNTDEPPSFRPTTHWSLGELVRPHGEASWEDKSYAVVAPLRALKGQFVNLSPHDTISLGNFKLSDQTVILVPADSEIPELPQNVCVIRYQGKLRDAVDGVIASRGGWHIHMKPEGVITGSAAYIENTEINDLGFFRAIFEEQPYLSYGTDIFGEKGEAFHLGMLDQLIIQACTGYRNELNRKKTCEELYFFRKRITYELEKCEQWLQKLCLQEAAMNSLTDAKHKLQGWLNIIDLDLEIQASRGKTLQGLNAAQAQQIFDARNDPDQLRTIADHFLSQNILKLAESRPLAIQYYSPHFWNMAPAELTLFINMNPEFFTRRDLSLFYAWYVLGRWALIKTECAHKEGLHKILAQALINDVKKKAWDDSCLFQRGSPLLSYLEADNNRLSVVLEILRDPFVKRHLMDKFGYELTQDVHTLEDGLRPVNWNNSFLS